MTTMQAVGANQGRLEIVPLVERIATAGALPARFLLAWIFIYGGIGKIGGWDKVAGFMTGHHMPLVPYLLAMTIFVEIVGGLALLAGFQARIAALVLFLFLIPTTLIFHNFWTFEGMDRMMQFISFQKNLAIMGGLLLAACLGPGGLSVDAWRKRK